MKYAVISIVSKKNYLEDQFNLWITPGCACIIIIIIIISI